MTFTIAEVRDPAEWDRLAAGLGASALSSSRWLTAVAGAARRPVYLRLTDASGSAGAIGGIAVEPPVRLLRRFGTRLFFYPGPAPPAAAGGEIGDAVAAVIDHARGQGFASVTFRSWDYPCSFAPPPDLFYTFSRIEFVLDLRPTEEDVRGKMRTRILEQVKQARRGGLAFEEDRSRDAIDRLLALLDATHAYRMTKGHAAYSYFFMPHMGRDSLLAAFDSGLARVFVARKDAAVVCSLLVLVFGKRSVALLIGSSPDGYALKAPTLVWFATIFALKRAGVETLNLGGVPNDAGARGLAFFKGSFGSEKKACLHGATRLLHRSPLYLLAGAMWKGSGAVKSGLHEPVEAPAAPEVPSREP